MVLVGHAFGAYLAAVYAIKHPTSVTQLVFSSPVGLEKYNRYLVSILSMIAIPSTLSLPSNIPKNNSAIPSIPASPTLPFHALPRPPSHSFSIESQTRFMVYTLVARRR
jgi:pimeloyl-ACP methyl ester carboxylesterase